MVAYRESERPRLRNVRTAKGATQRRVTRASRARYSGIVNFAAILLFALAAMMGYLMLTANLTSLNYSVARAQRERTVLLADAGRLDDKLAQLRSDERLAALAAQLGMRDPQQFSIVRINPSRYDRSHVAFLSSIASWFSR